MALTKLTENLNIHQSLPDQPTLSSAELKQAFDSAGNMIKSYINNTLTEETDEALSAKANSSDVYPKSQTYTKTETETLLSSKVNSSDVYLKGDFAIITGSFSVEPSSTSSAYVNFPENFTRSNCVVASFGGKYASDTIGYQFETGSSSNTANSMMRSQVTLGAATGTEYENKILVSAYNARSSAQTFEYKIVLMKIS